MAWSLSRGRIFPRRVRPAPISAGEPFGGFVLSPKPESNLCLVAFPIRGRGSHFRRKRLKRLNGASMTEAASALAGLAEIAGNYDALLCDVWGVVHNGVAAHPTAVEGLLAYRRAGGRVVLITNAPRPAAPLIAMLDGMGVPREMFDALISSVDTTRVMIAPYRGRVVHHFGPPLVDDALYEGLGVIRGPASEAEVVVVTDMPDDDDTPDMYADEMAFWLSRRLPMICANPDKLVEHGDKMVYCGGAMADIYEQLGGEDRMAGKPYRPIDEEAQKLG